MSSPEKPMENGPFKAYYYPHMSEYFTRGIVLGRETKGESDDSFTLYTKDLGKVRATAKSTKRIVSKLSGHLQVGAVCDLRLTKKNSIQLIEAMSLKSSLSADLHRFLGFVDQMTPYESPDHHLWHAIEYVIEKDIFISGEDAIKSKVYRRLLDIMGFGPRLARCSDCGTSKIAYFIPSDIMFLCSNSLARVPMKIYEAVQI